MWASDFLLPSQITLERCNKADVSLILPFAMPSSHCCSGGAACSVCWSGNKQWRWHSQEAGAWYLRITGILILKKTPPCNSFLIGELTSNRGIELQPLSISEYGNKTTISAVIFTLREALEVLWLYQHMSKCQIYLSLVPDRPRSKPWAMPLSKLWHYIYCLWTNTYMCLYLYRGTLLNFLLPF